MERGRGLDPQAVCPPLIYLDGRMISSPIVDDPEKAAGIGLFGLPLGDNAFTRIQNLPRDAIVGIEVYRNAGAAPGQFRQLGDACGIILVWTGRPGS